MPRSYKADGPQVTPLFIQFPLTITVICICKSASISGYCGKTDSKPHLQVVSLCSLTSLECTTKGQITRTGAILSITHHSQNDQPLADTVKGKTSTLQSTPKVGENSPFHSLESYNISLSTREEFSPSGPSCKPT